MCVQKMLVFFKVGLLNVCWLFTWKRLKSKYLFLEDRWLLSICHSNSLQMWEGNVRYYFYLIKSGWFWAFSREENFKIQNIKWPKTHQVGDFRFFERFLYSKTKVKMVSHVGGFWFFCFFWERRILRFWEKKPKMASHLLYFFGGRVLRRGKVFKA